MFPALLAHLQVALHKQLLVYCVHIMFYSNPSSSQATKYARNTLILVYAVPLEDEQAVSKHVQAVNS
jgi:hypothetical protein